MIAFYLNQVLISCIVVVKSFSMTWQNEIVCFSNYKQRRCKTLRHVLYRVQLVDIEVSFLQNSFTDYLPSYVAYESWDT